MSLHRRISHRGDELLPESFIPNIRGSYIFWFILAFAVCLVLTPLFGRIAYWVGIIDHPSKRRFHLTSMPMLGGVAVALTMITLSLTALKGGITKEVAGVLAAGGLLMALGLLDDIKSITPRFKLAGQIIAGTIIIACGLHIRLTGLFFVDYPLTYLWIIGIINCQNLLDNIDGLSGGTAAISACFFFIIAIFTGNAAMAVFAIIFSGACLGFLFHNFHPATIFSGDAGSMCMGSMLVGLGLMAMKPHDLVSFLIPNLILGLLIFDTGLVSLCRVMNGLHVTDGGRDHTSHRLCNLGMSIQGSVTSLFVVCFAFGLAGTVMMFMEPGKALMIPLILFFLSITSWFLMKNLYDYSNHPVAGRR